MKKNLWLTLMIFSLGVFILVACSGGSQETSKTDDEEKTPDSEVTEAGDDNTTLTIAMGTDIVSFDVHDHLNTSTEAVHDNMFNYLFKRDNETGEIKPELVDTYENIDETTWEFKLKEGVLFHNGDPLTTEDVKYSLERVAYDDGLRDHANYRQIKEVEIIDELNFKIITHNPEPALLNRISRIGSGILPAKYIEENGFDHFLANPVGTGPYQFVEWVRDDRIVFEPFEDYFEGKVDTWEKVVFRVIPENSTRVNELLTGGVDIAVNVPPSEWERVDANDGTSMKSETSNRTLMLFLRSTEGYPTSDVRVRQAIDYAIDNKAITENVLNGAGTTTLTRVAPGNFGFHEDLYGKYNYDLEKAKALLEEAGYPDGFEMTLHSPRGRYLQDAQVAEMVGGMLAAVGIKVNIDFLEWSNFVEMRAAKTNKDAYMLGLGNSMFDADNALDWYRSARFEGETDYKNEEVDRLLAEAVQNMDIEEREQQYKQIQEILVEEVPHIILHQESINIGISDRINYTPTMDEMLYVPTVTKK
ncbi:ABC transporter substrate-binding protein [Alkalihalobacillus sp. BA299]|uniref:ABC transporter substrate-binding protein n=1 Tax=Alkalihalobacillus sp. BA299 TaxID=2815938 RepID=UPI001ADA74BB|nr:ABC transporter substrate-binding protein [Alkalihalobacillus sp. BA299]